MNVRTSLLILCIGGSLLCLSWLFPWRQSFQYGRETDAGFRFIFAERLWWMTYRIDTERLLMTDLTIAVLTGSVIGFVNLKR